MAAYCERLPRKKEHREVQERIRRMMGRKDEVTEGARVG